MDELDPARNEIDLDAMPAILSGAPPKQLSGYNYVSARWRNSDEDFRNKNRYMPIPIRPDASCDHVESICSATLCVATWQIDRVLHWERTKGGRRLKEKIDTRPCSNYQHDAYLSGGYAWPMCRCGVPESNHS